MMIFKRALMATFVLCLAASCSSSGNAKKKATPKPAKVQFETNQGKFTIQLFEEQAPITSANFLEYVKSGFYTDVIFHRVIDGFMIQVGGFTADLQKKQVNAPIANEASNGLKNKRGMLSMARTMNPNSATSQFFINLVDNTSLDPNPRSAGYAVFGEIIEGMDVIDKIAKTNTLCPSKSRMPCNQPLPKGMRDVPAEPIVIIKARKLRK